MLKLADNTLVVFVSDSHIGGDPGCDGFESPDELQGLFEELDAREEPVELVLAGDFFDFLQISKVPQDSNRASLTISRPEYRRLFDALQRFRESQGKRVIYLPGNHDAEVWWNPDIQKTLSEQGLVDEFAYSYLATMELGGEQRIIYCEHGNQLDPANAVGNYADPLDTPLGHHVVTDFTRRVAPYGKVSSGLDLSEIKMVYPLAAIPGWVTSRYFYEFVGKAISYLLLPLLVAYTIYRMIAYILAVEYGGPAGLFGASQQLPGVHELFLDIVVFGLLVVIIFTLLFFMIRHTIRRALTTVSPVGSHYSPAQSSQNKIEEILRGGSRAPMDSSLDPDTIDVLVSGHTHLPSLREVEGGGARRTIMVNSGCWLRQLQPVSAHLKGPPVFVSKFVLTHVRIYAWDESVRVELWEKPRAAAQRLSRIERILSRGNMPPQPLPDSSPSVQAASSV